MRPSKSPLKSDFPSWQVADVIDYGLLKENAKANRNNLTEAESVFWNIAKSGGLGQKCRRQYIIGQYIVDFFFRQSMLIVEIDGGYHFTEEQQRKDTIRQDWLEHMGYKVLRFTNEEVLFDTDRVIENIKTNFI
jgi:very-short-patch-repair endonuclease